MSSPERPVPPPVVPMRRPRVIPDDEVGRAEAIDVLSRGGIVAIPTDTVYGIAVSLATSDGIERLFQVKRRPPEKGIALLLGSASQADAVGIAGPDSRRLAAAFWPGPLTLVLSQAPRAALPAILTDGVPTVGVRLPDHACPRALASVLGPLPTTSANLSGAPDSVNVEMVIGQLGDRVDLILDGGQTRGAVPSTVVDCTGPSPRVLREGVLGTDRILEALGS
ncbi:MAG: threonylcarbamoyl-AMP synthase [Chloroflexota bacterium]|nr:MAG: threonylcarbamoyl-AMP synthase [Chloroflexota bacterium]